MDVNQKRQPSSNLRRLIKPLIFKGNRIELLGSAGLQSQQYYSDYDLYSVIKQKLTPDEAYKECMKILDNVEKDPNMFFIEYKIQRQDDTKTKFYSTLTGDGFFSDISQGIKKVASSVLNTTKAAINTMFLPTASKQNFTFHDDFPALSIMYDVIDNAYKQKNRSSNISGYELIYSTPTLVFYKKDNIILVGVRGTADTTDIKADLQIVLGKLGNSARYKEDLKVIKQIHTQYPQATYYGVGHSLGSALVDRFLQAGLLSQAVSYNGAVEPAQRNNAKNKRIYISTDPLYKTMGRFTTNVEVREQPNQSLLKKALTNTSVVGSLYTTGSSHLLTNFKGGKKSTSTSVSSNTNYRDRTAFISAFHNVDYIKLDFIVREGNIFREMSIIYSFKAEQGNTTSLIDSLNKEIEEYIQEKNYYKALKRLFSLYKAQGKSKQQLPLSRFFNSKVGEAYALVSNLKALRLLLKHSTTKEMDKKMEVNMKDLHIVPKISLIPQYIRDYELIIQKEAKVLWLKTGYTTSIKGKKGLTVANLRALIKAKGLAKTMRGYTRWKKNILIEKLKDA